LGHRQVVVLDHLRTVLLPEAGPILPDIVPIPADIVPIPADIVPIPADIVPIPADIGLLKEDIDFSLLVAAAAPAAALMRQADRLLVEWALASLAL
jgi:hypothetical protein